MTRVRVLREAAEELEAIAQYYDAERAGLGRAFIDDVRRARLRIQERPLPRTKCVETRGRNILLVQRGAVCQLL
jgi:hypothetical protein